jgi:hypothetical protein
MHGIDACVIWLKIVNNTGTSVVVTEMLASTELDAAIFTAARK